jgi:single-strand DNA-binding protein
MRSINKVILIGNLTRDPELRQTPNGQSVCTFGIATNRQWATKEGEQHNLAEFHEVVAWARLAEICNQFLRKGKLVYLEGYLKTRSWDTPEGVRKFKTEVVIQDMIMLDRKKDNGDESEYIPAEDNANETPIEETPAKEPTQKPVAEKAEKSAEAAVKDEKKEEIDINGDLGL